VNFAYRLFHEKEKLELSLHGKGKILLPYLNILHKNIFILIILIKLISHIC